MSAWRIRPGDPRRAPLEIRRVEVVPVCSLNLFHGRVKNKSARSAGHAQGKWESPVGNSPGFHRIPGFSALSPGVQEKCGRRGIPQGNGLPGSPEIL